MTKTSSGFRVAILALAILVLAALMILSSVYRLANARAFIFGSYSHLVGTQEHIILTQARIPRVLVAALVGASLGVAGALTQALTRNRLAAPGTLGVNAGAACFVVVGILLKVNSQREVSLLAMLGASVAVGLVYVLSSAVQGQASPLRMVLAGAATVAVFSAITQGILVLNRGTLEDVLFWLAGSVGGARYGMLALIGPGIALGISAALLIAKDVNILAMGSEVARSLGQRVALVQGGIMLIIVILAGSAVALAGPIGFIGVIVPNLVRMQYGSDYRWVIPYSAVFGACLLIIADLLARTVFLPIEIPVGVMTALAGAPFFIFLARRTAA